MYELSPEALETLRKLAAETVEHTIKIYVAAAQMEPQTVFVRSDTLENDNASEEAIWRRSALRRYKPQSWKHTIIDRVPFRPFEPSEIYRGYRDSISRLHPGHNNLANGTSNVLQWLVADGVISKVGPGLYAPASNGVALQSTRDPNFYKGELRFRQYLERHIGPVFNAFDSPDTRFRNDTATVDIDDGALFHVGFLEKDKVTAELDALDVGNRLADGKRGCYLKLSAADDSEPLRVEKARDC